jgi:hypothetical protein
MLCLWSFLLGSWVTNLVLHFELGIRPSWISVISGIVAAAGGLVLWLLSARDRSSPRERASLRD